MKALTLSVLCALACLQAPQASALSNCAPVANCGTPDKPCNTYIAQGATRTLDTSFLAGPSVIRVRVCTQADAVCKDGADAQAVSVFGYSGATLVYTKHLNLNSGLDTGPYTKLPALTQLKARCSTVAPGAYCLVAWQHCKEALPVAGSN